MDDLGTILDIGERTGQIPKDHTHGYYSIILNWAQARAFIPAEFWAWIDELRDGILACSIRVPSATTLAEIEEIRKKYP